MVGFLMVIDGENTKNDKNFMNANFAFPSKFCCQYLFQIHVSFFSALGFNNRCMEEAPLLRVSLVVDPKLGS